MTPAQAKASYIRQLNMADTLCVVGENTPLRCRITGFQPDDVVVDLQQGDRKVILLADDVAAAGLAPLKRASKLLWNGKILTVKSIDDATRRVGGVLIAYELQVAGA